MRFSPYSAESGGGAGKADKRKAIKKLKTLVLTPKLEPKAFKDKLTDTLLTSHLPAGVDCREKDFGGIPCDILSPEVMAPHRLIIYIHGGCFVAGSRATWRSFCASLAAESSTQVIVPEYRLAPEFPYPAGLEDIQTFFSKFYEWYTTSEKGMPQIILAADGSGATLALAFVQTLSADLRQYLEGIVLLSPWLDINPESEFLADKKLTDGVLTPDLLLHCGTHYTSQDEFKNPAISPLYMEKEDFTGLPPMYIQCGEEEITMACIQAFQKKLEESNIPCILDTWPEMMFMFQMAHEYLPQAHLAVQRLGLYIQNFKQEKETE